MASRNTPSFSTPPVGSVRIRDAAEAARQEHGSIDIVLENGRRVSECELTPFEEFPTLATWDSIIPALPSSYSGKSGTRVARELAKKGSFGLSPYREKMERPIPEVGDRVTDRFPRCRCRIDSSGAIDVTECEGGHPLHSKPLLPRWNNQTISLISWASYLHLWSGWAAPSVFALLGPLPSLGEVRRMTHYTYTPLTHVGARFLISVDFEVCPVAPVIRIAPSPQGTLVRILLESFPSWFLMG